jgi:uncharacterized protein YcaQ
LVYTEAFAADHTPDGGVVWKTRNLGPPDTFDLRISTSEGRIAYDRPMLTAPHAISAAIARRYLAAHHLLAPPRSLPAEPASVMRVIDRLGSLQFDPLEVAGRNHDLVLLARVAGYRRSWTDDLLYGDRVLYETYNKMFSLVPTAELPWYRITWDRSSARHEGEAFDAHAPLVEELLGRIRDVGATSSLDIGAREAIDWYWRPTNQVRALLEAMAEAGVLAISRRKGNQRYYDLTERLFPAELLARRVPEREQLLHKLRSRYRAHGLLGATGEYSLWTGTGSAVDRASLRDELVETGAIVPVAVEGLRGLRFVPVEGLPELAAAEAAVAAGVSAGVGTAFVAPLDPLVWDRDLLSALYGFDYRWEVYVPAEKRRFGYYVLPLFSGDRFVGRIEPRIDRKTRTLRILGLWWETGFDPLDAAAGDFAGAFTEALRAHMAFADLVKVSFPRTAALRPLMAAVRSHLAGAQG